MLCPHFGPCGGCSRQDLSYERQLAAKEELVKKSLAALEVEGFLPILASPQTVFFRNKMEYSFGDERDLKILGTLGGRQLELRSKFAKSQAHTVTPPQSPATQPDSIAISRNILEMTRRVHLGLHPKGRFALVTPTPECFLMSEEAQRILAITSEWATQLEIPVFVRKTAEGVLRHLVIREGKNTGERMVKLVAKSETPHVDELADRLSRSPVPITTFLWDIHDGLSDVAHGTDKRIFWGHGTIQEKLGDIVVKITSSSFMQTNTHAAEQMIRVLKGWMIKDVVLNEVKDLNDSSAALQNDKPIKIIDLYCGSGAIGLNLAPRTGTLIGIETNASAVQEAVNTAKENGFENAVFLNGTVEKLIGADPRLKAGDNKLVVIDPPRSGLHPSVIKTLNEWGAPFVYYVSCNPESLARDLMAFSARYRILTVQPMDFFPHTDHVETAVRLQLKK